MKRDDAFIGGRWVTAPGLIEVENPATGEVIGSAAAGDQPMVDAAVGAARAAAAEWGARSAADRANQLDTLAELLVERRAELVDITVAELGAPVRVAREWHVDCAIDIVRAAARNARAYRFEEEVGNSLLLRRPAGVVGCVTPWNYPLYQLAAKVAPALAAGCTVVMKPAELAPLSSYLFAEAAQAAGLPAGVFNFVPGAGATVGAAIAAHPGIDVMSFTGSTKVGRDVARAAATNLTRVCLELGGKSASLVCADADLRTAVTATVASAMLNSGQSCNAWTRLLVPAVRYEEALEIAADHAASLVIGDPTEETTDLGPLASAHQQRSVLATIAGAVARGGRLVTGSAEPPADLPEGHFVRPTIIADVAVDDPASQQEIFGPVLVVHAYTTEDEAVAIANGTSYGLGGAVWAANDDRALEIARRLETGQVDLNGAPFNIDAPFGGWKDSGIGRELGVAGLEEYTSSPPFSDSRSPCWAAVDLGRPAPTADASAMTMAHPVARRLYALPIDRPTNHRSHRWSTAPHPSRPRRASRPRGPPAPSGSSGRRVAAPSRRCSRDRAVEATRGLRRHRRVRPGAGHRTARGGRLRGRRRELGRP